LVLLVQSGAVPTESLGRLRWPGGRAAAPFFDKR
jgi:hypothetical protein